MALVACFLFSFYSDEYQNTKVLQLHLYAIEENKNFDLLSHVVTGFSDLLKRTEIFDKSENDIFSTYLIIRHSRAGGNPF